MINSNVSNQLISIKDSPPSPLEQMPDELLRRVLSFTLYEGQAPRLAEISLCSKRMREAYRSFDLDNLQLLFKISHNRKDAEDYIEHPEEYIRIYSVFFLKEYKAFCNHAYTFQQMTDFINNREDHKWAFAERRLMELTLGDENPITRERAITALSHIDDKSHEVILMLRCLATDAFAPVNIRHNAVITLASIGKKDRNVMDTLEEIIETDDNWQVVMSAISAVAGEQPKCPRLINVLIDAMLFANNPLVAASAINALSTVEPKPPQMIDALIREAVGSPHWLVRQACINCLAPLSEQSQTIKAALSHISTTDDSITVRHSSNRALSSAMNT